MKLKQKEFLGSVVQQFDFDDFTISLVKYTHPVSEEWHSHRCLHLSLIMGGGNMEVRKNTEIQVLPGTVMFYNKGEKHQNVHTRFPSTNLNVEIKDSFFERNDLVYNRFDSSHQDDSDIQYKFLKIYKELQLNDVSSLDSINAILINLLAESSDKRSSSTPPWLNHLTQILSDRWDEFISLDELSEELNVHPVTISKSFPAYFDCTLADYMRKIKIDKAAYYLKNSRKPVAEIAFYCGFSDQSHLTRVFKDYTGFTPCAYRNL